MRLAVMLLALAAPSTAAIAQAPASDRTEPWKRADAVLILDPYAPNEYRAAEVASDPKVKAIIHQASRGMGVDPKFLARATEAEKAHLRYGAYHLGLKGDPIKQADLFVDLARKSGATFLALDIEAIGGPYMPLPDAERFARRVHELTGRFPALYVNNSVATTITGTYGRESTFAKMPLWIARFRKTLPPLASSRVWSDYTLWQFASELNCPDDVRAKRVDRLCEPFRPYKITGVRYDMDVNILNGGEARLEELFGPRP